MNQGSIKQGEPFSPRLRIPAGILSNPIVRKNNAQTSSSQHTLVKIHDMNPGKKSTVLIKSFLYSSQTFHKLPKIQKKCSMDFSALLGAVESNGTSFGKTHDKKTPKL